MDLSNLKPAKGSIKNKKRVGRGPGSGNGRTAGKGNNGYRARSGSGSKIHYEGGQTPLMRRLPKRGFKSQLNKDIAVLNLDRIQNFIDKKTNEIKDSLDLETLKKKN